MYLTPSNQSKLNIDHRLHNKLLVYLSEVMQSLVGMPFQGHLKAEQLSLFNATQLLMMIWLYEHIQTHFFWLMATDSVPKVG